MSDEKKQFLAAVVAVAELKGKELSKPALDLYWMALEHKPVAELLTGLLKHERDPARGRFFPQPADILYQLDGDVESRALLGWGLVLRAIDKHGPYTTIVFGDQIITGALDCWGLPGSFCAFEAQCYKAVRYLHRLRRIESYPSHWLSKIDKNYSLVHPNSHLDFALISRRHFALRELLCWA